MAGEGPTPRNWWDNVPDPWDRPYQDTQPPTVELLAVPTPGRRRAPAPVPLRQAALLALLVGAVLIGGGTAVRLVTARSTEALPPPTPPERVVSATVTPEVTPTEPTEMSGPSRGRTRAVPAVPAAPSPTTAPAPVPPTPTPDPPAGPEESATVLSYEAEAAVLGGAARRFRDPAAAGGEAVTSIGMWRRSYVEFRDVSVETAGEYQLSFHYLGNRARRGEYRINDGRYVEVRFPRVNGGEVGVVTVTVELRAGTNRIWFGANDARGPNLDRITVTG